MLSFIKKMLRIKPKKKSTHSAEFVSTDASSRKVKNRPASQRATVIPREKHRISKANISPNAMRVLNRLHQSGYEACLVGGGVRDLLLGIAPKDFDVATNARPGEVNRLFRNSMLIGHRFRIVHVQFGREIIEVTTFRAGETHATPPTPEKTVDKRPSRRAMNSAGSESLRNTRLKDKSGMILQDNIYGDISQDAWRRDFTINALYYDVADSAVVDFTDGYNDLQHKVIRLIGVPDTRYQEDPVRMLRAIRFAAKLNFTIEEKTAEPMPRLAHLISKVPHARLSEEIFKVYHNGAAHKGHQLLQQYGLFPFLFPQTDKILKNAKTENKLIANALDNTDNRVRDGKSIMPAFLIAALLWHPLQQEVQQFKKNGDAPLLALEKAMNQVIHLQNVAVAIPKRHWQVVREIWLLQYRFPRRTGPRPLRLLEHPRFRAAYDFLLIRALAGEATLELADWWTTFQEVEEQKQLDMIKNMESKVPPKKVARN